MHYDYNQRLPDPQVCRSWQSQSIPLRKSAWKLGGVKIGKHRGNSGKNYVVRPQSTLTSTRTEREAILGMLREALDIWSPDANKPKEDEIQHRIHEKGPSQARSPDCIVLSDKEPENRSISEHFGSPHVDRGAFNVEAAAPTASIGNPMTSDHRVANRGMPDTIRAETLQPIDTTIQGFITPLSELREAPYIGLSDKETPKNTPMSGHSGSLQIYPVAAPAPDWQHVFGSAGQYSTSDPGRFWHQAAYASPHNSLSTTKKEWPGTSGTFTNGTILERLRRLNSEVRY